MKKGMFTLALAITAILTACTKDSILEEPIVKGFASEPVASASVVTSWENGYNWTRTDSSDYRLFTYTRLVPGLDQDILSNGAILVFVKNIPLEDDRRVNKPIRIPFHVLPSFGKPGYDQVWYNQNMIGKILVKYRTNKHKYGIEAEIPDHGVQVRYFIISPSDLKRYGHTPVSISRLNYQELIHLLNTGE